MLLCRHNCCQTHSLEEPENWLYSKRRRHVHALLATHVRTRLRDQTSSFGAHWEPSILSSILRVGSTDLDTSVFMMEDKILVSCAVFRDAKTWWVESNSGNEPTCVTARRQWADTSVYIVICFYSCNSLGLTPLYFTLNSIIWMADK